MEVISLKINSTASPRGGGGGGGLAWNTLTGIRQMCFNMYTVVRPFSYTVNSLRVTHRFSKNASILKPLNPNDSARSASLR